MSRIDPQSRTHFRGYYVIITKQQLEYFLPLCRSGGEHGPTLELSYEPWRGELQVLLAAIKEGQLEYCGRLKSKES